MSKEKVNYSDVETNYLVEALQDVALEKYDFSNTPKIDGLVTTLKTLSKNNFHEEENLPISEKQVSILTETIEQLVPLIRKGYLILNNRYQKRNNDSLTLGSVFPVNFKTIHSYRAYPNLMSLFTENKICKHDSDVYLHVYGIGTREWVDTTTFALELYESEELISDARFCISLKNMDSNLYIATEREVVVRGVPPFKKTATFTHVDRLDSELINQMKSRDYKQAMKWLICSLIKVLLAVKDTNECLGFVEDNLINRCHKINFG